MSDDAALDRQHAQRLAEAEKLGLEPVGRGSPTLPAPKRAYDPYSELWSHQ